MIHHHSVTGAKNTLYLYGTSAASLTGYKFADVLDIKQGSVSKLERRTDLYISTLRRYIEAMGGELTLQARFPEGSVTITHLGQIQKGVGN